MSVNEDLPNFADMLLSRIREIGNPVLVGLDPHHALLPPEYQDAIRSKDRAKMAGAIEDFCIRVIDAVHDIVPAVKPQVAFFEQLGPDGYQALENVVTAAKRSGLVVISDSKRGDIGSTAAAYADYHIGAGSERLLPDVKNLNADAMTVNPYLGSDTLEPFLKFVAQGKGIFVLVKTSNPGSSDFQDRVLENTSGLMLYEAVAEKLSSIGEVHVGEFGLSSIGIVVGATYPEQANSLRQRFPNLWFLVPGFGAQGADAADVAKCFNCEGEGAIVNASRSLLFSYKDHKYEALAKKDWALSTRQAAVDMANELTNILSRE